MFYFGFNFMIHLVLIDMSKVTEFTLREQRDYKFNF